MTSPEINLDNCDKELIHIPGQVQQHGFLLVADADNIIRFYSQNIFDFIAISDKNIIGTPLKNIESLFTSLYADGLCELLKERREEGFEEVNPVSIAIGRKAYNLVISVIDEYYLLEFEPALSNIAGIQKMISKAISSLLAEEKLQKLVEHAADYVKHIIGYDRVMIYRFAKDGHGEVIAEVKNDNLEPWLGLHYPASDIPKQARELYKLNFTRLIADVNTLPSKIVAEATNLKPLNLTYSQLRAVSPVHIQYLKNMGVASSFSISLISKNELWGLIACHNYTTRFIDYRSREFSKLIGQVISSALEFRINEEDQEQRDHFKKQLQNLSYKLQGTGSIEHALTGGNSGTLLDVTRASGAVLFFDNKKIFVGTTPSEAQADALLNWAIENIAEKVYATSQLSEIYPGALQYKEVASGILLAELSKELREYIIWFKPEVLQTINWAGDPSKPVEMGENGEMKLSPRHSFAAWSQSVEATSETWSAEEIKSATALQQEIFQAVNLKSGAIRALNESLRQAYEELDTFSYTISHDLKNPLAAIKSYAHVLSLDSGMGDDSRKMLQRITEKADQMNTMMNAILDYSHLSRMGIPLKKIQVSKLVNDLVKDLDTAPDSEQLQIKIGDLPDMYGDPILIMQVFSNLISNAIKYSRQSRPAIIEINGSENIAEIVYQVRDNGTGIPKDDFTEIFGLFIRLENTAGIEGSGIGLAIVKRIMEKHNGKVWVESEPGKGTTFFISFNKNYSHLVP